jgi:hypothetical protein
MKTQLPHVTFTFRNPEAPNIVLYILTTSAPYNKCRSIGFSLQLFSSRHRKWQTKSTNLFINLWGDTITIGWRGKKQQKKTSEIELQSLANTKHNRGKHIPLLPRSPTSKVTKLRRSVRKDFRGLEVFS